MNRVIAWLLNLRLRQILTVFLVGITVFVMQAFGYSNQLQAHANTLIAEGYPYQSEKTDTEQIQNDNKLVENSRRNLKATADTVREKVNPDEPVAEDTKNFFQSVQESIKDAVNAITGNEQGDNKDD